MANHQRLLLVSWNLLFLFLISGTKGDTQSGFSRWKRSPAINGASGEKHNTITNNYYLSGPMGDKGESCEKGDTGDMGPIGRPGLPGFKGESGEKGDSGEQGPIGLTGPPGMPEESREKGEKGEQGPLGPPGLEGLRGLEGLPGRDGLPGLEGPPGQDGLPGLEGPPGICASCSGGDSLDSKEHRTRGELYGTFHEPAFILCKDEDRSLLPEGKTWYVGTKKHPIEVFCKQKDFTTCASGLSLFTVTFDENETKPFWLSQKETNDLTILSMVQLQWLQEKSSSVYHTIRYHCKNTQPYYRDDLDKSILLLTWDNMVIGPEPSLTSPLYYIVPEETDGCSRANNDEWSYTDIMIETKFVQRLPVVDFLIREVKNKTQEVSIEHLELCFK